MERAPRTANCEEDGRRLEEYGLMDSYWSEPNREVMLIRANGRLAGFVMVNDHSHADLPLDYAIAEFFVARKHRREGVGIAAAVKRSSGARPGLWELAVARRNTGAQPFWRRVAAGLAAGEVEELDRDDERWNGLILRFRVAG